MIDYEVEVQVKAWVTVSAKSAAEAERVVASMKPNLVMHHPELNQEENQRVFYEQKIHKISFYSTKCIECRGRSYQKSRICWPCRQKKDKEAKANQ